MHDASAGMSCVLGSIVTLKESLLELEPIASYLSICRSLYLPLRQSHSFVSIKGSSCDMCLYILGGHAVMDSSRAEPHCSNSVSTAIENYEWPAYGSRRCVTSCEHEKRNFFPSVYLITEYKVNRTILSACPRDANNASVKA